eukprot:GHVQ01019001.1.p1 GENE.GHVQ01019001.1~~GHVQ01019001.1.p1  ORF type:complete len:131 (+),score=9.77 GHVQ01019001.1:407-799(+)
MCDCVPLCFSECVFLVSVRGRANVSVYLYTYIAVNRVCGCRLCTYIHVCVCACVRECICMYVWVSVCMCVCTCVYMYVCVGVCLCVFAATTIWHCGWTADMEFLVLFLLCDWLSTTRICYLRNARKRYCI